MPWSSFAVKSLDPIRICKPLSGRSPKQTQYSNAKDFHLMVDSRFSGPRAPPARNSRPRDGLDARSGHEGSGLGQVPHLWKGEDDSLLAVLEVVKRLVIKRSWVRFQIPSSF